MRCQDYFSTKATKIYSDAEYPDTVYMFFGKETKGLPEELLAANKENCVRIPMVEEARSLNLSNAVAVVVYDIFRQQGFKGLKQQGQLTQFSWSDIV